jgi:hypothetical protein
MKIPVGCLMRLAGISHENVFFEGAGKVRFYEEPRSSGSTRCVVELCSSGCPLRDDQPSASGFQWLLARTSGRK